MSNPNERRRGEPDGDRASGPSRATDDGANASRVKEKDQGFNESHGYPPGHGGPTSPGDAPAKSDASDAHDPSSRKPKPDTQPDRK